MDSLVSTDWLAEHLGLKLSDNDLARVREMDNPDGIPLAYGIGCEAAERQVKAEHWIGTNSGRASAAL